MIKPRFTACFCLVICLPLASLCAETIDQESCSTSLTEPVGELHLLQAAAKKVVSDKQPESVEPYRPGGACNETNTIWDLGFFDGGDAALYLNAGYCVVAVEADPTLVQSGSRLFDKRINSKQLKLLNLALKPERGAGERSANGMTFWRSKCKKQWNSFFRAVGCRACAPPHKIDPEACWSTEVSTASCGDLFTKYGTPHYMKIDIEGAEPGCFESMETLVANGVSLPKFISAEVTNPNYVDMLHKLGYKRFKLVNQAQLMNKGKGHSGPWGDNAFDCRVGKEWRTYKEVREEVVRVNMPKDPDNMDAQCPRGVSDIREEGIANVWYDVHAML